MPSQNVDRGPTGPQHPTKVLNRSNQDAQNDVSSVSMAYATMLPRWNRMNALLGGTASMREAGKAYLPMHDHESKASYETRLSTAVLLNYTDFTLGNLVGKAFRNPPTLDGEANPALVDFIEDVDGAGTGLAVFARQWFRDGLAKAFSHVLVDYTAVQPKDDGSTRTKADDDKEGVRPYWVLVSPENLIFAHSDLIDGREVYTHVRIRETAVERVGFAEVVKERIRVLEPGVFQLWEKDQTVRGRNKWKLIQEGTTTLSYIPLVTFYTAKEGPCEAKPVLEDLAHLNVLHWQSSSDQRNILTVARFPILAVSGAPAEDSDTADPLKIGPRQFLSTTDPQGKFYYLEHTGAAIGAGRQDLLDLEEQMSMYGADFLKQRPGSVTATGKALDSSQSISPLQAMGVDFKDALELALVYTADWLGLGDEPDCAVLFEVAGDAGLGDGKDLDVLDKARSRKDISRVAYIAELKRRSVLDEDYDPEEDEELIEKERENEGVLAGANGLLACVEDPESLQATREALRGKKGKPEEEDPKAKKPIPKE